MIDLAPLITAAEERRAALQAMLAEAEQRHQKIRETLIHVEGELDAYQKIVAMQAPTPPQEPA